MTGALLLRRPAVAWAALVLATCLSWILGDRHHGAQGGAHLATAVALTVAFLKAQVIGSEFMELRRAPTALRAVFGGWVLVVGTALLVLYLMG